MARCHQLHTPQLYHGRLWPGVASSIHPVCVYESVCWTEVQGRVIRLFPITSGFLLRHTLLKGKGLGGWGNFPHLPRRGNATRFTREGVILAGREGGCQYRTGLILVEGYKENAAISWSWRLFDFLLVYPNNKWSLSHHVLSLNTTNA